MKIVETTIKQLVLEDRPAFLAGLVWFMGLVSIWAAFSGDVEGTVETALVAALGIGALWTAHHFFPFQRLTFDKETGRLSRVVARINGQRVSKLLLSEIERAAIEAQWSEGSRLERLILVIGGAKHPVEFGFYGASRSEIADEINEWLSET